MIKINPAATHRRLQYIYFQIFFFCTLDLLETPNLAVKILLLYFDNLTEENINTRP